MTSERFVATSYAQVERANVVLSWPECGRPIALDLAADCILKCFDAPLSVQELTDDLVAAVGMTVDAAQVAATAVATALLQSGHLRAEGEAGPLSASDWWYPPAPSP